MTRIMIGKYAKSCNGWKMTLQRTKMTTPRSREHDAVDCRTDEENGKTCTEDDSTVFGLCDTSEYIYEEGRDSATYALYYTQFAFVSYQFKYEDGRSCYQETLYQPLSPAKESILYHRRVEFDI